MPAEHQAEVKKYSDQLIETVAATDDALIERYLGGEEIPREEVIAALKTAVVAGSIVPLFVRQRRRSPTARARC